jgi:hypothetical protein
MAMLLAAFAGCRGVAPITDKGVRMTLRVPITDVPVGAPVLLFVELENTTDREVGMPSCWRGIPDSIPRSDEPPSGMILLCMEPWPPSSSGANADVLAPPPPVLYEPYTWALPPRGTLCIDSWTYGLHGDAIATAGTYALWADYETDRFTEERPAWLLRSNVVRLRVTPDAGARLRRRTRSAAERTEDRLTYLTELAFVLRDDAVRRPRGLAELRKRLAACIRDNAAALETEPASPVVVDAWLDELFSDGWGRPLRAKTGFYSVGANGIDEWDKPDFGDDIVMLPGVPPRPPRPSMAAEPLAPRPQPSPPPPPIDPDVAPTEGPPTE